MKTHSMLIGFATVFCAMQMPDAKADETPTSINAVQSKYKTGQMWSYKTRPSEKDSTFVVLGVENDGKYERKENIVYVALENLKFSNPLKSSGVSSTLIFLPVYESALNKSAKHLVKSEIALPQYADLYRQWRELRDKGVGGAVYTVSPFPDYLSGRSERERLGRDHCRLRYSEAGSSPVARFGFGTAEEATELRPHKSRLCQA